MLVCGEPSGDQLGAQLMIAIKRIAGDEVRIVGVGGAAMTAQGLDSLFPLDDTAVMGLREVVPRIPAILKRVEQAADYAIKLKPDAVVLIDSPDFTHRIARRLKRIDRSIRTINYVAPQIWASRQYRARKMARYFDLVLALLRFEVLFFLAHGVYATFVGHPVIERASRIAGGPALRQKLGLSADTTILALLPGSRMSEVRLLVPCFREAVAILRRDVPDLTCVLPTVPHVSGYVRDATRNWPSPLHIVENDDDKFAVFDTAQAALAASGTVTTELALAGVPMVVAYRLGWLTYLLARPFVNVPYITLINIVLDRPAITEFVQRKCTGPALAREALKLLRNATARETQRRDAEEALEQFGAGGEAPSLRAARAILDFARGRAV
jgi:lipid-A-disaccharide synthase